MKHIDVFLGYKEISDEAALAIAFSAARGVGGPVDFDRKAMTDNDIPISNSLVVTVCRTIAARLNPYLADFRCENGNATLTLKVREKTIHKAEELLPGLIHTAAVALMTSEWQSVTSPGDAGDARSFAEDRLSWVLTLLSDTTCFTARRPLFPF